MNNRPKRILSNFALINYMNPVTGALAGGVIGGVKGGLEQTPYEEIGLLDRVGKVATNAVLGSGVGASLGFLPKLATMDGGLNKIASTVENQTGVKVLPIDSKITKVNAKTASLENEARRVLENQKLLERRRANRQLRQQIRNAKREQLGTRLVEGFNDVIGDRGQDILATGKNVITGTVNAGKKAREIVNDLEQRSYSKHLNIATFSTAVTPSLYGVDKKTLATTLGLGASVGTAIGGLKGGVTSLTNQKIKEQEKLAALTSIQDPYLRYRQEEIYNSSPARVGRTIDSGISTIGTGALMAGIGAGVGAGALGGALVGLKYLRGKKI